MGRVMRWPDAALPRTEPPLLDEGAGLDDPGWDEDGLAHEDSPPLDAGGVPPLRAVRSGPVDRDECELQALMQGVVGRDERALARLYDATSARVYGLVLRITRRAALAEEVVEDTYWQVWRQAPRFDAGRGRVSTWLLAIARSRAIDALRRDERFRHDELPEDDSFEPEGAAGLPAHDLLEATRSEARVHAAIATLEPRARQLVALAFFRGLTHEEIAAQTAMPLGSVKSLIRRSLQQLRTLLDDPPRER